jgi:SET domain-containing protein
MQCVELKADGSRCKNKICIGCPFCYVHLLYNRHLRIKQSTLPRAGKGLFALNPKLPADAVIFQREQTVVSYFGEILDIDEKEQRYETKTAPYSVGYSNDEVVDSALVRGVASNANTNVGNQNTYISIDRHNHTVNIKASKPIKNGQEIFIPYGKNYKLNERGVQHSTKYVSK